MAELKTKPHDSSVEDFLARAEPAQRRYDGRVLAALMERITGEPPTMWAASIIGFGSYHYRYESGREGEMCRIGFSPRKASLVLYLTPGFGDQEERLARLGKHSTGKGCLYIKRLADVDMAVLEELLAGAWAEMRAAYP